MSGLSRTPGKRVRVNSPPRVRIPPSPPGQQLPPSTPPMKKILSCLLFAFASHSFAASGEVELVFAIPSYTPTKIDADADSYFTVNFKPMIIIDKSNFELIKTNDVMGANCVGWSTTEDKASHYESHCMVKDVDGDTFLINSQRASAGGTPGAGKQQVKGIKGKYAGMTGSCTFKIKTVQNDGLYVAAFSNCQLQK